MLRFKYKIFLLINKIRWRLLNKNNSTSIANVFNLNTVSVGNYSYGSLKVFDNNSISKLRIGNFCSIAPNVTFILNSDHYTYNLSSFPFKVMALNISKSEAISYGDIILDDDVWIGYGVTVLSGVHIGQGAIVAAGAVVSKNVPPYSIVGGVPAKVLKYRFSQQIIDYLMTLDYKLLTESNIRMNLNKLYIKIDEMSLDEVKDLFNWFPKKYVP